MRALFLSCSFPENPKTHTHGIFNRMRTLVKGVAAPGVELTVLFFVSDPVPYQGEAKMHWEECMREYFGVPLTLLFAPLAPRNPNVHGIEGLLAGALSFFKQENHVRLSGAEQVSTVEAVLVGGFDFVFAHRLASMVPLLLTKKVLPRVFLDMDDIEHVAFAREITQPPVWRSKYLRYLQIPALIYGERLAIRLAEKTLVCSHLDVTKLESIGGRGRVAVLPNSVSLPARSLPSDAPVLLFLGTFNYLPNVRAVEHMLDHVWPRIIEKNRGARLVIGGLDPQNIRHFTNPPRQVSFAGYIPDLNAAYRDARAVVCPVLSGGGTRVKIVEAAAYGRAVVSTSLGAEGLEFEADKEILIGDSPEQFAGHCLRLLQDVAFANRIGSAARHKAEAIYDKAAVIRQLQSWVSGT